MTPAKISVIPALQYRDARAAIDFLCKAFGFEKNAVYEEPDGSIVHAQLTLDNSMVMLGSVKTANTANFWFAPQMPAASP